MKSIFIIAWQELKILCKDRQALALLFLMPLALITFLTFALQNVYQAKVGFKQSLVILAKEDCQSSEKACTVLVQKLKKFGYETHVLKELSKSNKADLVLQLPDDTENTIQKLQKQQLLSANEQIQILFNPLLDQATRALVESHLMLSLQAFLIERLHQKMAGSDLKVTDVSQFSGLVVTRALGGFVLPNPIQQTVPAWSLFGMFFILIPLTNSMIRDRHLGVFKRLLSFPVTKTQLILGKMIPFFLINILQFVVMFSFGLFVLPKLTGLQLQLDFDYMGLIVVTIACAVAATSYGLLVSCLAETSEQAHAFGAFSLVILAIIGGVMIPSFVMPPLMQKISIISPMHWGLQAYSDLLVRKLSLNEVLYSVRWLFQFSLVFFSIASLKFRWSEGS